MINVSLVLYNNSEKEIEDLIKNIVNCKIVKNFFIIDNSEKEINVLKHKKIIYKFNTKNFGYGRAHNFALKYSLNENVKAHLIINPDIIISEKDIEKLYFFLMNDKNIGIVVPKVIYPNGEIQYISKLLPTPKDLIFRRFFPNAKITKKNNEKYELRFTKYEKIMEIGVASGSCMMIKKEALEKVGLFDERFFMYLEDYDLSRRVGMYYKVMLYPEVTIVHRYEMHSYKKFKMLIIHIISAIKYFNKWGWFYDKYRERKNLKILEKLKFYQRTPFI